MYLESFAIWLGPLNLAIAVFLLPVPNLAFKQYVVAVQLALLGIQCICAYIVFKS